MKTPIKTTWTAILAALFLSACVGGKSNKPQEYFVLSSSQQSNLSLIAGEPQISIRQIRLPDYLNQRLIVKRNDSGKIFTLNQQFWAEKLTQSIPHVLAKELAAGLRKPVEVHPLPPGIEVKTTIEVDVSEFLADDKQLSLQTAYRLIRPKQLKTHHFATTVTLSDSSTMTLVQGYQTAVTRLAADIAKHL